MEAIMKRQSLFSNNYQSRSYEMRIPVLSNLPQCFKEQLETETNILLQQAVPYNYGRIN